MTASTGHTTARFVASEPASARRRLLCLIQLPPPVHGVSVINQTVATSELLASHFDIEVVPLAFAASMESLNRPSIGKLARMIRIAGRLAHSLATRRPDAVYFTLAPTGSAFYRDCLFIAIMKLAGVPRIYHLHGKGVRPQLAAPWRRRVYTWAFRDAWVIHLAERLVADIEDLVPRDHVMIVPNGIADRAAPDRSKPHDRPRLLFLSNMIESKGPFVLVEALGLLRARGIAFEATFAGAVADAAFLTKFHTELKRLDLARQVRYVGPAYGDEKHRLLDEHDVFVFPTYNDAFPLVALEAMQASIPIVTTDEGALPEIVEDGETGVLVPRQNAAALADRLAGLLSDGDLQRRMGARARERHEAKYTLAIFESNLAAALMVCTRA